MPRLKAADYAQNYAGIIFSSLPCAGYCLTHFSVDSACHTVLKICACALLLFQHNAPMLLGCNYSHTMLSIINSSPIVRTLIPPPPTHTHPETSKHNAVTGLDYWTHQKWCRMSFPVFFSVGEKLIMYIQPTSLLNSCKFAPLTC